MTKENSVELAVEERSVIVREMEKRNDKKANMEAVLNLDEPTKKKRTLGFDGIFGF